MTQFEPAGPLNAPSRGYALLPGLRRRCAFPLITPGTPKLCRTSRRVYRPSHETWRGEQVALRIRLVMRELAPPIFLIYLCAFAALREFFPKFFLILLADGENC